MKKAKAQTKEKVKKPFYKKWWAWLLAIVILASVFGDAGETPSAQNPVNDPAISDANNIEQPSDETEKPADVPEQPEETQPEEHPQEEPEPVTQPEETPPPVEESIPEDSTFEVHFIDVGQADAALVLCDGKAMLIDGGNSEDSSLIYSFLKKRSIDHLDYIVATHAHEDHIGGLSGALNYATVGTAYCPVTSYDSKAFSSFVKYLGETSITIPAAGDSFKLGSAAVTILAPVKSYDDPNNTSIVLRIEYGDTSFLFTGDAERESEQDILNAGYNLTSTVLKVGHHGSESSTTYPFLREIMPEYAVISVGTGNSYGHPTEDTLSRLRDADVKVYRTDLQGDIKCTSDGKTVSFSVAKNENADTLAPAARVEPTPAPVPTPTPDPEPNETTGVSYILNTNSKKFHYPDCGSAKKMKESNKEYFTGTREEVIARGFSPCGNCDP